MRLRCYCCGEPIGQTVALVTMQPDSADRVFVLLPEHVERLDDAAKSETCTRPSGTAVAHKGAQTTTKRRKQPPRK
jgi:hypothetical protein